MWTAPLVPTETVTNQQTLTSRTKTGYSTFPPPRRKGPSPQNPFSERGRGGMTNQSSTTLGTSPVTRVFHWPSSYLSSKCWGYPPFLLDLEPLQYLVEGRRENNSLLRKYQFSKESIMSGFIGVTIFTSFNIMSHREPLNQSKITS